jgi:hypothetical protein
MKNFDKITICFLAFSIALAGYFIGWGIKSSRQNDRFVSVKGVSEKAVKANQGAWNIVFSSAAKELNNAIAKDVLTRKLVMEFLISNGLTELEIRPGTPRVDEIRAYDSQEVSYRVNNSMMVMTKKIDLLAKISARSSELLEKGIALTGYQEPAFYFSKLSNIKPQMIAQATKDARKAAEQFAKDAKAKVGNIRRASQGYFSFQGESSGLSESQQINKIARVVVNIEFLLEN